MGTDTTKSALVAMGEFSLYSSETLEYHRESRGTHSMLVDSGMDVDGKKNDYHRKRRHDGGYHIHEIMTEVTTEDRVL